MDEEARYVEEAETQYTEWKGTVALDELQTGTVDDAFGLGELWAVVGISLFGGIGELVFRATVYAVERSQLSMPGLTGGDALQALADANYGEIPVVRFDCTKATVEDVLRTFKRFHIVALPTSLVDPRRSLRIERVQTVPHRGFTNLAGRFEAKSPDRTRRESRRERGSRAAKTRRRTLSSGVPFPTGRRP